MNKVKHLRQKVKDLESKKATLFYRSTFIDCMEGFTLEDLERYNQLSKQIKETKETIKSILYA